MWLSCYLCKLFLISLGKILYFSLSISCINNARVIPKYVVLFVIIVNEIFKVCLISGSSLELSVKKKY